MKERPILFSVPMVLAILEGCKTQTRRVVKATGRALRHSHGDTTPRPNSGRLVYRDGAAWDDSPERTMPIATCPYGEPCDRLWVRETTIRVEEHGFLGPVYVASENGAACLDGGLAPAPDDMTEVEPWELKLRPAIHMPRAYCRLVLEITDVRVQRLQDISAEDCIAEGLSTTLREHDAVVDLREQWQRLWTSINGADSWATNPWVWAITFRRVTP